MLKLPDGTVKVLVEGVQRARIVPRIADQRALFTAKVSPMPADEAPTTKSRPCAGPSSPSSTST
jgi:Lon protease-like protein